MRIDRTEYEVLVCRRVVDGKTVEYLSLMGPAGFAAAVGRTRGELLGDFRRRQIEGVA